MYINVKQYYNDLNSFDSFNIAWGKLRNKNILITGATGLIGTFLIDLFMYRNKNYNDAINIFAVGRSKEKAVKRFMEYFDQPYFTFIQQDIQSLIKVDISIDYIIHGASNTHPVSYATEPINTILTSVLGTKMILDYAVKHNIKRTLFLSTVEIYGENRGDVESFKEDYSGYIDCNTSRACYPEGKRTAEALCQAYIKESNADVVIARCCRVYGPTMGEEDSKVIAQFIRNCVNNNDIILKSKGNQIFSYCYVADICSALITLLLEGKNGEAYNISDSNCKLSLLQIATLLSEYTGTKVIFENPSLVESQGYSKASKALVDSTKLENLGWRPKYSIQDGLIMTIEIIRGIKETNGTRNTN